MSMRSFSRASITQRLFNTPLAVLPSTASVVLGVVGPRFDVSQLLMHAGGAPVTLPELEAAAATERAGIEAKRGIDQSAPGRTAASYDVSDGVAHINIRGELVAENGLNPSSGFTGYDGISAQWASAQADTAVKGVILDIDSPGGEVTDLFELASVMMQARGGKPSRAIIRGTGASAAYALACACDEITVQEIGRAGSVGVITMHADFSGQLEQDGVKVTLIYAGDHKADGNPFEALPDAVRASIQADIDRAYNLFVGHVATARGMSEAAVRATQARVYQGQLAVDAGLVDKVMGWADSQAEFVASVNGRKPATPQRSGGKPGARASMETAMPGEPDNASVVASQVLAGITNIAIVGSADHALALAAVLAASGSPDITVSAVEAADAGATTAGADAERTRILALVNLCPETTMSASLTSAIEEGSAPGDFAIGLATAAKTRGATLADLRGGAVQPDQLPKGGAAKDGNGTAKPLTGAARGAAIVAKAAQLGHAAVVHLTHKG